MCKCNNQTCKAARRATGTKTVKQILKQAAFETLKNVPDAYSATVTVELARSRFPYGSISETTLNKAGARLA